MNSPHWKPKVSQNCSVDSVLPYEVEEEDWQLILKITKLKLTYQERYKNVEKQLAELQDLRDELAFAENEMKHKKTVIKFQNHD